MTFPGIFPIVVILFVHLWDVKCGPSGSEKRGARYTALFIQLLIQQPLFVWFLFFSPSPILLLLSEQLLSKSIIFPLPLYFNSTLILRGKSRLKGKKNKKRMSLFQTYCLYLIAARTKAHFEVIDFRFRKEKKKEKLLLFF